ncbi:MAG: right-handed parallel beta-helix repeat-containing protein [Candidatus Thorarchaeota archaeon]|nr:right-handed parallel beta-helix repeat-containing protein [Candidatus Thorarchaeota archaeon]
MPSLMVVPLIAAPQTTRLAASPPPEVVQVAGARLSTYTEHVPIIIKSTQDFISQGWPGSGTELDPFLILGLNISYDVGLVIINITNTDAYFKIVDCVANQLTSGIATILFENVSHATIEYSTVTGQKTGIELVNATNTAISHVDVTVTGFANAAYITDADHVSVSNCIFNSTFYHLTIVGSNFLSIRDTSFVGTALWFSLYISNSNHTTISGLDVVTAFYFAWVVDSFGFSVDGSTGTDLTDGFMFDNVHDIRIIDTSISAVDYGVQVSSSVVNMTIDGCQITTSSDRAITMNSGNLTRIINNHIYSSHDGIYISTARDLELSGNVIEDIVNSNAVTISGCTNLIIRDNTIRSISSGHGIALNKIANISITGNTLYDVSNYAISGTYLNDTLIASNTISATLRAVYAQNDNRLLITSNTFSESDYAGYIAFSDDVNVSYNTATDLDDSGFYFSGIDTNLVIVGNEIVDANNYGIHIVGSSHSLVERNMVMQAFTCINLGTSPNSTVQSNVVQDFRSSGLSISTSGDSEILNNTAIASRIATVGILVTGAQSGYTFSGNQMYACGFKILRSGITPSPNVYTMNNNTIGGLPVYYGLNKNGISIDGSQYGQVILVNSTNVLVQNGSFVRSTIGISLLFSNFTTIDGVHVVEPRYGVELQYSHNVTIKNSSFLGGSAGRGVYLERSSNLTIMNSEFTKFTGSPAIDLNQASVFLITNVSISDSYDGLTLNDILNLTLLYSTFENIAHYGMYASGNSDFAQIYSCTFINASFSIRIIDQTSDWVIDSSTFLYSPTAAIKTGSPHSDYINITNCYFEGNDYGIYSQYADYWRITGNTFRWNIQMGIYLSAMTSPIIYSNTFVGNKNANGYDTASHFWDDGVDTGNAWDDYSGSGSYPVSGGGGATDRYPTKYLPTSPIVSTPLDVSYAEGTEHYFLTWNAYDDYLVSWNVTCDGALFAADAWNYDDVTLDIGGLAYGDYTFVITLRDNDANTVQDTVLVYVYDGTAPQIEGPFTMIAFVGASGQVLAWNVSDLHPANYSLYVDDTLTVEDDWTTGTITYDVSGLAVGDHEVRLVVRDISRNETSNTVLVRMIQDVTSPSVDSPADLTIYYGSIGNTVVWTPTDLYPESYTVTLNGTAVASGDWSGAKIVINVDGLDLGVHQFTLTVYDASGNSASDEVAVTVVSSPWAPASTTTVTPSAPIDPLLIGLVVAGVAGAIIIVVVLYMLKKRRAA